MRKTILLLLACVALNACATADFSNQPPRMISAPIWATPHFKKAHPDLLHRLAGQVHFEDGRFVEAVKEFTQAARFGDKLSQAMLAEMYWQGQGVSQDRASAYAWMDLAAERGFVAFVAKRERFWAAMSATEREEALQIGRQVYADHGDAEALKRLGWKFSKARKGSVAMRLGLSNSAGIVVFPGAGPATISATGFGAPQVSGAITFELSSYYAPEFWRMDRYVRWHEQQLDVARRGTVELGPVQAFEQPQGNL